ncbi:MAG: hypothetical protein GY714_28620 [Desulfobacterales bacterium]|nr:hypothetical protein [Desulfobacterales bacterium]
MKRKVSGILSNVIFLVAVAYSIISIRDYYSRSLSIYYLIGSVFSVNLIIYFYCGKCSCRDSDCAHVIPGYLTRFLPKREDGPYSIFDYTITVFSLIFMIGMPNYIFWGNYEQLGIFNGLIFLTFLIIYKFVCLGCENKRCTLTR